jgi:hypothetical protein
MEVLLMEQTIRRLEEKLEQLTTQVGVLEDTQAIRKLHHQYGYYLDQCLYNEVLELFADNGMAYFMGGIYKGKEQGVRRLYIDRFQTKFTKGHNGPIYGFLLDHPQMQDVITVSPDRKTAKGRFRCLMQAGLHESAEGQTRQWWEGGLYENEYVNEDGVWKIKTLNYRGLWHGDFDKGWAHTPPNLYPFPTVLFPEDPIGPDELITDPKPWLWPDTAVVPFHYPHPVTGEKWEAKKTTTV